MSASAATRLRQLATQYHGGELDLASYRRLRAELLDRLTATDGDAEEAGSTTPQRPRAAAAPAAVPAPAPAATPATSPAPVPAPVPVAKAPKAAPPRPVAPATTQPSAPEAQPPAPKGGGKSFIVVALVAVVVLGAAGFFFMRPAAGPAGAAAEPVDTTSESYVAITDFLAMDDWGDEQIANFNTRWATLPDDLRTAALDQPWYQNFVERVRSRVKEQRALTATAESAGTVEGPLAALANSVGIDISAPDRIATPPVTSAHATAREEEESVPAAQASPAVTKASASKTASPAGVSTAAKGTTGPAASGSGKSAAGGASNQAAAATGAKSAAPAAVGESPEPCRAEYAGTRKRRCRDALSIGGFGPFLVGVRSGEFDMGSKEAGQEQPVHHVRIEKPFAIAEYETSQAEYRLFCTETRHACEAQPWTGDDLPVVKVSWQDARDYVAWLSKVSGNTYRLATEAEWEYAARGGTAALYPSGDALSPTDAVFTVDDKLSEPWPRSRQINANAFKLFHTIGNVREWVEDTWSADFEGAPDDGSARRTGDTAMRVVRGGAYNDTKPKLRVSTREGLATSTRDVVTGFRVVREF